MNSRESGTIYFIAGLLFGGIIGAGMGLMLPAEQAERTREQLKKTGSKVLKDSLDAIGKFEQTTLTPAINKATNAFIEQVDLAKTDGVEKTVNKVINKVQSAVKKTDKPTTIKKAKV